MNSYKTVFDNIVTYQQLEAVVLNSKAMNRAGIISNSEYSEISSGAKEVLRRKYSDLMAIRHGREPKDPNFFRSYKGNERMIINLPL